MPQRKVLVVKFGGTSMRNQDCIAKVMDIVQQEARRSPVVTVVSAMAGVTDRLLAMGEQALKGRQSKVVLELETLKSLHEDTFGSLANAAASREWIRRWLEQTFAEISSLSHGIRLVREFSDRTRDKLLSYGEILSSRLLAKVLHDRDAAFVHSDARDWLLAEWNRHGAIVDFAETDRRVGSHLVPLLERGAFPVTGGFICRLHNGETATLGRNGSDYSAAIVGGALRAREIWIYTDVDGIMTADPNLVAEAKILKQISYQEAAEMSFFGAKVLHPKTLIPAILHKVPIRIKNTFRPESAGTLIADRTLRRPVVKTVTSVRDLSLVNVQGNGMLGIPLVTSRMFAVLAAENVNVMMISQSSSEHNICIIIREAEAEHAVAALRREFNLELERNLIEDISLSRHVAIVSIIGAGMRGTPGISGKFFDALGKYRINVLAIAQGGSELNISAAIWEKDYQHAVQAIHSAFGLTRDLNVFVFGCGNIGRTLLKQIDENRRQLAQSLQVNVKVLGVANSRQWRFAAAGLPGAELRQLASGLPLEQLPGAEPRPAGEGIFDTIAGTCKSDVVIVDATAAELAGDHIACLRRGFHVVSANKKPLTSAWQEYEQIQFYRRRKGLNYQYEATFGAGLPLLSTLQDMIQTGDRILRIQGCLSGTLGLICTRIDEGVPFSDALAEAISLGYTEPDPRDDLSGRDVARKCLIIARAVGFPLEMDDIRLKAIIPSRCFGSGDVQSFLSRLPQADPEIRDQAEKARAENCVLRYMVDIHPEVSEVGLQAVPRDSPIGRLAGPDNILVFQTQRYFDHPLVIQGPGAGASVTAAGVLSDILKIAKWI